MTTTPAVSAAVAAVTLAVGLAAPSVAQPAPTTQDQLCATQAWPRPLPDVTGQLVSQTVGHGALGCWANVLTVDGRDAISSTAGVQRTDFRITGMSPSAGTPAGRTDVVTLQLTPVDPAAPAAFHP